MRWHREGNANMNIVTYIFLLWVIGGTFFRGLFWIALFCCVMASSKGSLNGAIQAEKLAKHINYFIPDLMLIICWVAYLYGIRGAH